MNAWRPSVRVAGHDVSSFQVAGVLGFLAATAAALGLGAHLRLSIGWLAVLAAGAALSFLAVAVVTWASLGVERLVFYRHQLVVLAMVALASWASGRPALAYLDVAAVALGLFLAFGRIGCATVGCCHGLPAGRGLRYGPEHAAAGFAWWLVGVPLAPVQLLESALVVMVTALGAVTSWRGAPPGAVFAQQLVGYALLRFVLEHLRGDIERPTRLGLSEAQWTTALVAAAVAAAERAKLLPPSAWHAAAAALLAGAAGLTILRRQRARLFGPAHVAELARIVRDPHPALSAHVHIRSTSLGVRLSASAVSEAPDGPVLLYSLSGVEAADARALASLLRLLRGTPPATGNDEIIPGRGGLYHLLLRPGAPEPARPPAAQPEPAAVRHPARS